MIAAGITLCALAVALYLPHMLAAADVECSACDGEGYRYLEQAGRQRVEAVVEVRCHRCGGTGVEPA